ncbi:unnamed protein product, partial [Ixodes hexagonus]
MIWCPSQEGDYASVVDDTINSKADVLNNLGEYLWENPELKFKETKAHDYITQFLESEGFHVQRHYILPTAFRAEFEGRCRYVAFMEYLLALFFSLFPITTDGFPCRQAANQPCLSAREAIARDWPTTRIGDLNRPVSVAPSVRLRLAIFDQIFYSEKGRSRPHFLFLFLRCLGRSSVKYTGRTAHAGAAPWDGINALDAAVGAYVNVSLLRQQMKPDWRATDLTFDALTVRPTSGEARTHVLHQCSTDVALVLRVRALGDARHRARAQLLSTISRLALRDLLNTESIVDIMHVSPLVTGLVFSPADGSTEVAASTDAGNVSHVVPSLHPMYKLNTTAVNHTPAFAEATKTQESFDTTLTVAKALGLTALDVMRNPDVLRAIKSEFE